MSRWIVVFFTYHGASIAILRILQINYKYSSYSRFPVRQHRFNISNTARFIWNNLRPLMPVIGAGSVCKTSVTIVSSNPQPLTTLNKRNQLTNLSIPVRQSSWSPIHLSIMENNTFTLIAWWLSQNWITGVELIELKNPNMPPLWWNLLYIGLPLLEGLKSEGADIDPLKDWGGGPTQTAGHETFTKPVSSNNRIYIFVPVLPGSSKSFNFSRGGEIRTDLSITSMPRILIV